MKKGKDLPFIAQKAIALSYILGLDIKSEKVHTCNICNLHCKSESAIFRHIEAKHIEQLQSTILMVKEEDFSE